VAQRVKAVNKASKNVEKFKYLGTTLTNQNCINEEINSGVYVANHCY